MGLIQVMNWPHVEKPMELDPLGHSAPKDIYKENSSFATFGILYRTKLSTIEQTSFDSILFTCWRQTPGSSVGT